MAAAPIAAWRRTAGTARENADGETRSFAHRNLLDEIIIFVMMVPMSREDAGRAFDLLADLQERAEDEPELWPTVLDGWQEFLQREDLENPSRLCAEGCLYFAIACVGYYDVDNDDAWAQNALNLFASVDEFFTREAEPDSWAMAQFSRGNLHLTRYGYLGHDDDAQLAKRHFRAALEEFRRDTLPGQWAMAQYSLGALHGACYERSDDPADAEEAEACYRAALAEYCRDDDLTDCAVVQNGLANLYSTRFERGHDHDDAHAAEECLRAALAVHHRDEFPQLWAKDQLDLGTLRLCVYELSGVDADATAAEAYFSAALQEYRRDVAPADWALAQHRLGDLFTYRYKRSSAPGDAEHAARCYREALTVYTEDSAPARWADVQHSLGNLLSHQYEQTGDDDLADLAASYCEAALAWHGRERSTADSANAHSSLGSLYSRRYERSGDAVHAQQAGEHYRTALAGFDRGRSPALWAMAHYGLGVLHLRVSQRDEDEAHLAAAERHLRATGEVYREDCAPTFWSAVQHALGHLHTRHYEDSGDEAHAARARDCFESTLASRSREAAAEPWASAHYNLGTLHARRYVRIGDDADARSAEQHYRAALGVFRRATAPARWATLHHNLGALHARRHRRSGDERHAHAAGRHFGLVLAAAERYPLPAMLTLRAGTAWTRLLVERARWHEAAAIYPPTARALAALVQAAGIRRSKESWLQEAEGLVAHAAYALARLGRLEEAVEVLEEGRARLLAEALATRRRDLDRLVGLGHEDLLSRFRAASTRLAELQARLDAATDFEVGSPFDLAGAARTRTAAQEAFTAAVAAIREVPGYADFFVPMRCAKIQATGTPDVVYLATTAAGGVALRVTHRVDVCWLDGLTAAEVRTATIGPPDDPQLGGYLGAYVRWRGAPSDPAAEAAWRTALDGTTRWLWDSVMGPLLADCQGRCITLIPTGLLGLLPLHAAWRERPSEPTGRRYAIDDLSVRYAPSAAALLAAQETSTRTAPGSVLAVDDPGGALSCTRPEVDAVLAYFSAGRGELLRGNVAARDTVLAALPRFAVQHFATHGWSGWDEPLRGGLLMAQGEPLTVGALLDLRLTETRLAVLSACETGLPGTRLPDEVVGLPAAFLQAGVAGVVASLWRVDDLGCAMLMERFYRGWIVDRCEPAEALRAAQRWLRDSTNREKVDYFRRDIPLLTRHRMPESTALLLFNDRSVRDPDARSFAHPFWWAAFALTGV